MLGWDLTASSAVSVGSPGPVGREAAFSLFSHLDSAERKLSVVVAERPSCTCAEKWPRCSPDASRSLRIL